MQALFVLLGFAMVAGIGALLLRSFVLTVVFAIALALVTLQWSSDHEHARATVAVGIHSRNAETMSVHADDVDASFLSRLATATVAGNSRRIALDAKAADAADAISSVRGAAGRIQSTVSARLPSSSDANERVSNAESVLTQATAKRDEAESALSAWRAAKGSGNPTALRQQAEAVLAALERQQRSPDPATAQAAALAIPPAQQQVFDYSSAELQLGQLTSAREAARREVKNATSGLHDARVVAGVVGARQDLVRTGPIRVQSVDNGPGLRAALVLALIVFGLALAFAVGLRWRSERVAVDLAGVGAGPPDVDTAPAPATRPALERELEPRPVAERAPIPEAVVDARQPPAVLRSEPIGDLEPMVFTPESGFVPQPFARPHEPPPPRPAAPPDPSPPAAPSEPEPEPFTVLVYRAPGAKAGKDPAPTFEVRELAAATSVPGLDLAGVERAEGSAPPETIDLTDAVADAAEEDETTRRPEQ